MAGLETRKEFTGETALAVLAALCCLPLGFIYYFSERETKEICPECRASASQGAAVCPNCNHDLTQYRAAGAGAGPTDGRGDVFDDDEPGQGGP